MKKHLKKPSIESFFAAYLEWVGLKSGLKGQQKRFFYRWACVMHPELWKPYIGQPALFRAQCMEVVRGMATPRAARSLGEKTLKKFAPQLVAKYMSVSEESRGAFQDFLDKVLKNYETVKSLERFLQNGKEVHGQNCQKSQEE